jgi:hypothetical protein
MSREITPAERLGRTANLVIFLGVLSSLVHLIHWLAPDLLLSQSYGLAGLGLALGVMGLGYGIRYGSRVCLYVALGAFAMLSLWSLAVYALSGTVVFLVRYVLSAWAFVRLCRAVPIMRSLCQSAHNVFPLPMSRYGQIFLRRWQHRNL